MLCSETLTNTFSYDGGSERPSFTRDPETGWTTVEWQRVYDARIHNLRRDSVPIAGPLYSQLVVKGDKTYVLPPGVTQYNLQLDPHIQADFYVEFFNPLNGEPQDNEPPKSNEFVHRTEVSLAENFTHRGVDHRSFQAIEDSIIETPKWFREKYGFSDDLTQYVAEMSQRKIVFIAKAPAKEILDDLQPGWSIVVDFDADYKISRINAVNAKGEILQTFDPGLFYIKGSAAFNDNEFHWDDGFWSWGTAYRFRAMAESTLDFWYDVGELHSQKALGPLGGFIPREVRGNLTSFHYVWDMVDGKMRYNTELVNPNIVGTVEWDLYSLGTPDSARNRLPRAIQALKNEIDWKNRRRATMDKNGIAVPGGFWTSNLGSGMDNQPRCGGIANKDNYHTCAWIDMLAQQIISYRELARMNAALGHWSEFETAKTKMLELAKIMNEKFWSEEDGMFLDLIPDPDGNLVLDRRNPSIANVWAFMTGLVPRERMRSFIEKQMTPSQFGGDFPFPSLPRSHPLYEASGGYWLGGHWLNMVMVGVQAIEVSGYSEFATHYAAQVLARMTEASEEYRRQTGKWNVWEFYGEQPTSDGHMRGIPGRKDSDNYTARGEFTGWSFLPPFFGKLKYIDGWRPVPGFAGPAGDLQHWLNVLSTDSVFTNTSFVARTLKSSTDPDQMEKIRQGYVELNLRIDPADGAILINGVNYPDYNRIHKLEVRKISDNQFELTVNSDKPFNLQLNRMYGLNPSRPRIGKVLSIGGGGSPKKILVSLP